MNPDLLLYFRFKRSPCILFQTRLAYLKYMTKVGKLLGGGNDTKEQMAKILELEGKIAKVREKYCVHCMKYC